MGVCRNKGIRQSAQCLVSTKVCQQHAAKGAQTAVLPAGSVMLTCVRWQLTFVSPNRPQWSPEIHLVHRYIL
jgi:hypothetical protein